MEKKGAKLRGISSPARPSNLPEAREEVLE